MSSYAIMKANHIYFLAFSLTNPVLVTQLHESFCRLFEDFIRSYYF